MLFLYLLLGFAVVIFVIMCFYKLNSKNYDRIVSELERGTIIPTRSTPRSAKHNTAFSNKQTPDAQNVRKVPGVTAFGRARRLALRGVLCYPARGVIR